MRALLICLLLPLASACGGNTCTGVENSCGLDDAGVLTVTNCEAIGCANALGCGTDVITRTCKPADTCFMHTDLTGPWGPSHPAQTSGPIFACSSWLPDAGP